MADEKKSLFERFTQFVLPLVVAVAAMFQQQRSVALALIALGFVSLAISTTPSLLNKFRQWRAERKEKRTVAAAMGDLADYVDKFSRLASIQTTDTLHNIVFSNLCGSNASYYESLGLFPAILFDELCAQMGSRLATRQTSDYEMLRMRVGEFGYLISSFCRYFANPIYEKVPGKLTPELAKQYQPYIEKGLITFRERFVSFLESYSEFVRALDRKLARPLAVGYYFQGPPPLRSLAANITINGV